jgi:hypothetical protein
MSDFLENLKNAADNGEFNSDAAKKILEITELADQKMQGKNPEEAIEDLKENIQKLQEGEAIEPVTEKKAIEANTEYEKKMEAFKKQDLVNNQLATLIEIEDMVVLTIGDMFNFISELEKRFEKEIETKDPMFGDLLKKIEEIKSKYES